MNKKIISGFILNILIILFTLNIGFSSEEINSYDYIKVKINNNLEFGINKGDKYSVANFNLNSYFLPQTIDGGQYLNSFKSNLKNYKITNTSNSVFLQYSYNKSNLLTQNKISNEFILESVVTRPKIKTKVFYPLDYKTKKKYSQYLQFIDLIDTNEKIKKQASEIAKGEDDVFIIASKVSKWITENVNYDLSTISAMPNQKSSEVFESRAGVCKEITNLFISMMRSLGIPTRVVSGYAYTTSNDVVSLVGSNWGGHAWSEVLIGNQWVPFDSTYNQYGFVDATHIVTDKYIKLRPRSVSINASGYNFQLVNNSLKSNNKFQIIDYKSNVFNSGFEINLEGPTELSSNSYGYIEVKIENKEDFYQILFLTIAKTKETILLDSPKKMVIFRPNEKKTVYFRYKLPILNKGFKYTFPFTIYNEYLSKNFIVIVEDSFSKIKKIALPKDVIQNKTLSKNNLNFDCNYLIKKENNTILCSVSNPNNYEINNLQLCISTSCQTLDLKLNEVKSFIFETNKYNEILSYYYSKERGNFEIKGLKPKFKILNKTKNQNEIVVNYEIENKIENLFLGVYFKNESKKYFEIKNKGILNLPNNFFGNITYKFELKIGNNILDKKEFIIKNKKPIEKNKTFIKKIFEWILNLIRF